ncbi:MAG: 50S ribosomal protein L6 [Flavobacteriales bacterium]|jgi:large subunit ribosomal protein L6|nr:50S ribosomal protein L6 [Flavobacteriales bacterium]
MSRIGKAPINVPNGATVTIEGKVVTVKGKLGELKQELSDLVDIKLEDGVITLTRVNESKDAKAQHGLFRALVNNMVEGVTNGYKLELELVGVGFRASNQGQTLDLSLGFSHNIIMKLADEVKIETKSEKGKNPIIILSSHDKQLLGMVAAKIRSFRKPEPYKGKGVRFVGEEVRKKAGKTA